MEQAQPDQDAPDVVALRNAARAHFKMSSEEDHEDQSPAAINAWCREAQSRCKQLRSAARALAIRLAHDGRDIWPLNELARLLDENADDWLEDPDGGLGKQLLAYAAVERLLITRMATAREVEDLEENDAGNLAQEIAKEVAKTMAPIARKPDVDLDEVGHDLICEAWNNGQGFKPTWKKLAEAVQKALAERGRNLQVMTVQTHLKQRAPRTKAKMKEIQAELVQRRRASRTAQKRKTLPPEE